MRIAIVSPSVDRRHGTERHVAELVRHLTRDPNYEVHVYSQHLEDLEDDVSRRLVWHRVPGIPGPHLVRYLWWFVANQTMRWWDRWGRGLRYDLVYSPGINCLDADVISVHIVFTEFFQRVRDRLRFRLQPVRAWPRLFHRRVYYRLIMALERWVYGRGGRCLVAVSRKVARDLNRFWGRGEDLPVVYHGIDPLQFHPGVRCSLRPEARRVLGLPKNAFALLLIGNDWRKKGLDCLLEAVGRIGARDIWVLVVGRDDPVPYRSVIRKHGLEGRVRFLPPRSDVEFYYAAADVYVGPSLEDAFALPPAEAMACGLPVIVSSQAGVSEIITHGLDGLVLEEPRDPDSLAHLIRQLYKDPEGCRRMGGHAAQTAQAFTWEKVAQRFDEIFRKVLDGPRASS